MQYDTDAVEGPEIVLKREVARVPRLPSGDADPNDGHRGRRAEGEGHTAMGAKAKTLWPDQCGCSSFRRPQNGRASEDRKREGVTRAARAALGFLS